jgi:hypothetical protein
MKGTQPTKPWTSRRTPSALEQEETAVSEEQFESPAYQPDFSPEHNIGEQNLNFSPLIRSIQSSAASTRTSTPSSAHSFSPPTPSVSASFPPAHTPTGIIYHQGRNLQRLSPEFAESTREEPQTSLVLQKNEKWQLLHVAALDAQMQSKLLPKPCAILDWLAQCPAESIQHMNYMDKQWLAGFLANFSAELYTSEYFCPNQK